MFHHPGNLVPHEGADDLGRESVVVLRGQPVADIMQKRADDPVDVRPFPTRPCGRLQAMLHAGDLVAGQRVLVLALQLGQDPFRCQGVIGPLRFRQQIVVFLGAVFHLGEGHCFHGAHSCFAGVSPGLPIKSRQETPCFCGGPLPSLTLAPEGAAEPLRQPGRATADAGRNRRGHQAPGRRAGRPMSAPQARTGQEFRRRNPDRCCG